MPRQASVGGWKAVCPLVKCISPEPTFGTQCTQPKHSAAKRWGAIMQSSHGLISVEAPTRKR